MNHFLSITEILLEPITGMEYPECCDTAENYPGYLAERGQHRTVQSWDGDWLPG